MRDEPEGSFFARTVVEFQKCPSMDIHPSRLVSTRMTNSLAYFTHMSCFHHLHCSWPSSGSRLFWKTRTRAKETADIIAQHLPGVTYAEPDPLLNEGRPCHHIPGTPVHEKTIAMTDEHHRRIEQAYQKYFYRSEDFPPSRKPTTTDDAATSTGDDDDDDYHKHEFEIIVCHANVIRYFLCRALQLPPEAWLRYCPFNCSMTYITIRPSGNVSCRMLGDIGHLPYDVSTFSKHVGFKW
jgi:broad specificity phosphatase PhoE